ncbi:PEGA domain-containing protein [Parahaliea mediterranea]|uniref:PEGA domain-containing protein n=1 Tax=Parahaliea mediterranea TaxID=651086 RepID=A0A939DDL3_9GAMM|nr:PEGA domain-containing protein [Parahaliea mediterranea]MBN7795622.1 PEGA domain-containing protein [Parahaliea mediterranea]
MNSPETTDAAITPAAFEPLTPGARPPGRERHPLRWVLLACAALFALLMAFLLTARSVLISVEAQSPASLEIGGPYLPFGERILIRPGQYALTVTAEGYYPLETTLPVSSEDSQELLLKLEPLPGRLVFTSTPPGARVVVDGEELGLTPLENIELAAGPHQLQVLAERHLPWERPLEVTGREQRQTVDATLQPGWAEIGLASEPAGATITVGGEAVATTPAVVEVMRGEQQLGLELAGFAPWSRTLDVAAGEPQDLGTIALEPASGILSLRSEPTGANVTLDGDYQGQTPLVLELAPDRAQRINISRPGYRRYNEQLTLAAGERAERDIRLEAQLGELRLSVSPQEAQVAVNGRVVGRGDQVLSLPAFEHSIEVSLEGYAPVRRRVTPRSGIEQRLAIALQTQKEAKLASLSPELTTAVGQTLKLFIPAESPLAEFTMGASRRESGRRANEVLRPVALKRMFYLQTTEVTNAQFRQFQPNHNSGQLEGNSLNREHQPVAAVSWQQAAQFCNWLSRKEGLEPFYTQREGIVTGFNPAATGYRLPTEAEWAWAARADGETLLKFPWGDTFPPTKPVENYADNTSAYVTGRILSGYTDGYVVSAPVASFAANTKGLHDLGGNVAEWVNDVYTIPAANGARETDPLGAQQGDNYVVRGASWSLSKLSELRLSYRDYGQAARDDVGFRIARYAE